MATKKHHPTPMLDELENGPWPSFISGIKRLRDTHPDPRVRAMNNDLLGQLEHSYETRKGYWKGGTVSVYGYGGGIIPRFSEVGQQFPESKEFHTLRVQPPAGNYYTTKILRQLADSWEKWGSGLITFHGQTGNIMFIGSSTENTQHFFDEINDYGFDLGGAGPCVRTAQSCVGAGRCEQSCANEHKIHRALVNNFTDDIHRPAAYFAAIARRLHDEHRQRRAAEIDDHLAAVARQQELDRARGLNDLWHQRPVSWLRDALQALAHQWRPDVGLLFGGELEPAR